jgi:hypothetical protein
VTCAAHPAFTPATIVNRALGKAPAPAVRKLTTLGTATCCRHGECGAPLGAPTERLCGEFHRTRTLHRFRRSPTRTHNANDLRLCTCPDFQLRSHAVYAPSRRHLPLQGALSIAGALAKKARPGTATHPIFHPTHILHARERWLLPVNRRLTRLHRSSEALFNRSVGHSRHSGEYT